MSSFDKLSPEAIEALSGAQYSDAEKLFGKVATSTEQLRLDNDMFPESREMSDDYLFCVSQRYEQTRSFIEKMIDEKVLPYSTSFPTKELAMERAQHLSQTFDFMEKRGWQPDVFFVPQSLSPDMWNNLFQAVDPNYLMKFRSLVFEKPVNGNPMDWFNVNGTSGTKVTWDLAVISISDEPIFDLRSPGILDNGTKEDKEVKEELLKLPGMFDNPVKSSFLLDVIRQASPTGEMYLAMQLSRIQRDFDLADEDSATIGRDYSNVGMIGSVTFDISSDRPRTVINAQLETNPFTGHRGVVGIRPARKASDLL